MITFVRFFKKEQQSIIGFQSKSILHNRKIKWNGNEQIFRWNPVGNGEWKRMISTSSKWKKEQEKDLFQGKKNEKLTEEEEKQLRERIQRDLEQRFQKEKKENEEKNGHKMDWAKEEMGYPILRASSDWIDQQKKERLEFIINKEKEDEENMKIHMEKVKQKKEENERDEKNDPLPEAPETMDYLYRRKTFSDASVRQNMKEVATYLRDMISETIETSPKFKVDRGDDPREMEALRQKQSFKSLYVVLLMVFGVGILYYFREEYPINLAFEKIGYYLDQSRFKLFGASLEDQGIVSPRQQLIPKANITKRYTLVIDPSILSRLAYDGDFGLSFKTRPAVEWFLTHIAKDYEIIIFHDGNWVLFDHFFQQFDPTKQLINYKIYSEGTFTKGGDRLKNYPVILQRRNPNFTIFLETQEKNYNLVPENCLLLPAWEGSNNDETLKDLGRLLMEAAETGQPKRFVAHVKETTKLGSPQ